MLSGRSSSTTNAAQATSRMVIAVRSMQTANSTMPVISHERWVGAPGALNSM